MAVILPLRWCLGGEKPEGQATGSADEIGNRGATPSLPYHTEKPLSRDMDLPFRRAA
jgi:hypothetical protein